MLKYLNCIDCWLSLKKRNKTIWVVLQRLTLFRDGTKLPSILFIPLNDFGAGTWDFSYLFLISHLLFTAWACSPVAPTGWIQSNDSLWPLTIWRAVGVWRWWFHWASLQPEIWFCDICKHQVVFGQDICICPIFGSFLCVLWVHTKNSELYFLGKYCNSGLMSSSKTFRATSNFVPFLQCEKRELLPLFSHFHGWYIFIHITFQNQYALSDILIFILLSLY